MKNFKRILQMNCFIKDANMVNDKALKRVIRELVMNDCLSQVSGRYYDG